MDEIGPVDYAAFAFPGNEFKGEITPALADIVEAGTIRIIDAVFVTKNENGGGSRTDGARAGRSGGARSVAHRSQRTHE